MRKIPFLFCRYVARIDDDILDAAGLAQALSEIQGQYFAHGAKAEREARRDVVVMSPQRLEVAGELAVTWAIGHVQGHRIVTDYDPTEQVMRQRLERDSNHIYTKMLAIPRLGALAADDRTSATFMGGRVALSRMRSAFRHMPGGSFDFSFLAPEDVLGIIDALELSEYSYTVRRINPTPPGALAAAFDATMEREGVGIQRGVAKPMPGGEMHIGEGIIGQTAELATGGYGVVGFKGHTEDGSLAAVRKPPFSLDKAENLRQMEKEQPLRVYVEEAAETEMMASVVGELVRFYDRDETTGIPEESV